MRHLYKLVFIFFIVSQLGQNSNAQTIDCYNIRFAHKDSILVDSMILPIYQKRGFLLVKNGVYDFVIDGKKYFQSLLLNIENNGFWIATDWEFSQENQMINDSIHFKINQDLNIRCLTIDKGVGGLPFKVDNKKYNIEIVKGSSYCRVKNAVITTGKEIAMGHFYFTGYGWKMLKMVKGKPFLCEETGEYILRRK
jgi:hypothetical protein